MKRTSLILILILALAVAAFAQPPREDAIWARMAQGALTLDGVLDEADWAFAETWVVEFGANAGVPGSGWKAEAGWPASDPTYAVFRFLASGDDVWMAVEV